jgi:hypothetical protein
MNRSNFEAIIATLARLHDAVGAPVAAALRAFDSMTLAQARGARALVPGY